MYQLQPSIYRELARDIIEEHRDGARATTSASCARARRCVERLATDWHYFARPTKTLFNDIRIYFPMSAQLRVYKIVDRYMTFAERLLRVAAERLRLEGAGSSAARRRAAGHRASAPRCRTTATARRTSTWPRPRRSRSPPDRRVGSLRGADRARREVTGMA